MLEVRANRAHLVDLSLSARAPSTARDFVREFFTICVIKAFEQR
jgi:hypothetical protein